MPKGALRGAHFHNAVAHREDGLGDGPATGCAGGNEDELAPSCLLIHLAPHEVSGGGSPLSVVDESGVALLLAQHRLSIEWSWSSVSRKVVADESFGR